MPGSQARRGRKQTQARDPLAVQNGSSIRKTAVKTVPTNTSLPEPAEDEQQPAVRHPRGEQADHLAELEKEASKAIRAVARQARNRAPPIRTQPKRAATKRASPKPPANAVPANAAATSTTAPSTIAAAAVEETYPDNEDEPTRAQALDQGTLAAEIAALQHEHARLLASNQRLTSANEHLAAENGRLKTRTSTLDAKMPGLIRVTTALEAQVDGQRAEAAQLKTTLGSVWDFLAAFDTPGEAELEVVLDFLAHGKEVGRARPASWKVAFEEAREWKEMVRQGGWRRDGVGRWRMA